MDTNIRNRRCNLLTCFVQGWAIFTGIIMICCGCGDNLDMTQSDTDIDYTTDFEEEAVTGFVDLENVYEESRQDDASSEIYILVVADTSGSMSKTHFIVREILQLISALGEMDSELQVEYVSFNATGAENVLPEELDQMFGSNEETSVYKGMEKTKEWIDYHCNDADSGGSRAGVIILSDLFTTRTRNNERYDRDSAQREQQELSQWMEDWEQKERNGSLSICFVTWESLTEGEDKEKTYEYMEQAENAGENAFINGYQVVMDKDGNNTYSLDSMVTEKDNELHILEKESLKYCLQYVMDLIVGENNIEQEEEKKSERYQNCILYDDNDYYQIFLQISRSQNVQKNKVRITGIQKMDDDIAYEIPVKLLIEGKYTELYYVSDAEQYEKIFIESEECVVNRLVIKKTIFQISARSDKGNSAKVIIKAMQGGEHHFKRTIMVELLDEQGNIIQTSDHFTMDENNKKFEISLFGEGEPFSIRVYYKNENGEWELMDKKKVI